MVAREDGPTTTGRWRVFQPKKPKKLNDKEVQFGKKLTHREVAKYFDV